jgi:hypothetical protein
MLHNVYNRAFGASPMLRHLTPRVKLNFPSSSPQAGLDVIPEVEEDVNAISRDPESSRIHFNQ